MTDRVTLATEQPWVVVGTDGLLAEFNNLGVLNPLDVQAAQTIGRLLGEDDETVLLAAALAVRGTRFGHVCIRLDAVRDAVVVDGQDPEEIEQLPWPEAEAWTAAVTASPLVGVGTAKGPLILEDGRLYLERYYRYEELVADLVRSRLPSPSGRGAERSEGGEGVGPDTLDGETTLPLWEGRGSVSDRGEGDSLQRDAPTGVDDGGLDFVPPAGGRSLRPQAGGRGEIHASTRELLTRLLGPDTRQHAAAVLALTGRFAVIAGGPGTGKTHTVAAMLAALAAAESEFPTVALCAPTGKAAARLGEALDSLAADINDARITEALETVEPSTIHRLLGWTWDRGRFMHDERNPLPHDLVIVDEMSMVSLPMAAKLLAAVRDEATVVLVGDPYQLESIEAGTVLADIVGAGEDAEAPIGGQVAVLERGHRFEEDSAIADFAEAVRLGDPDTAVEQLGGGVEQLGWVRDRRAAEFAGLWDRVVTQRVKVVELAGAGRGEEALAELQKLAVLCARRKGPDGVAGWGRDIERALDERFIGLRWGGEWYPGRPVMITKNDYGLELYNGDIGVCVETGDGLRVLFDRGREFPPSHLGDNTTVHAMTIHKSQGSQFDEVVVVLPGESSRLLTRELLYTAVTRASSRVSIVGGEGVVRGAVDRSVQRASGLGARIRRSKGAAGG